MRIETYFQDIRQVIEACPIMQSYNVRFDKRGTYEGFIKGELYLVDGSTLHLREFVVASYAPDLGAVLEEIEPLVQLPT